MVKKSIVVDPHLEESIKIWEERAKGNFITSDCPLCKVYECNSPIKRGLRCPVKRRTGQEGCNGTPYWKYSHKLNMGTNEEAKKAAQEELDFLKSLREVV